MAAAISGNHPPKPPDPQVSGPVDIPTSATAQIPVSRQSNMAAAKNPSAPSYASMVSGLHLPLQATSRPSLTPRFPPISLPSRQVGTKEGRPAISFTAAEVGACERRFEFSLVAKFTVGRPSLGEIQKAFQQAWSLSGRATISEIWDGRHILIILDSESDVKVAMSSPLHKIGHAFFRLFRWTSDYNPRKESKFATIWVRLKGLPLELYDSSFIEAIVSTFGYFVAVDERTKACVSVKYARACVELDVTQPIPDSVWISLPNDKGYWQNIDVESNIRYCSKCRVHGHKVSTCRKAHPPKKPQEDGIMDQNLRRSQSTSREMMDKTNKVSLANMQKDPAHGEKWVEVTTKKSKKKVNKRSDAAGSSKESDDCMVAEESIVEKPAQSPRSDSLAMVIYASQKDCASLSANNPPISVDYPIPNPHREGKAVCKTSSPELFYDEKLNVLFHPNAEAHYANIRSKAGSVSLIRTKADSVSPVSEMKALKVKLDLCKVPKGSKHCPSPGFQ